MNSSQLTVTQEYALCAIAARAAVDNGVLNAEQVGV